MARGLDKIETDRLILRGIDETDAEAIVVWRSVPDVYKYFKFPHKITIDEHLDWFHNRYLSNENRFDWICIEKESGQRIGVFGLVREDDKAEVNYLLSPDAQHKGYANEAIRGLIKYASETWNVRLVVAEIHEDNTPSISLVEKMGFTLMSCVKPFVVYGIEV